MDTHRSPGPSRFAEEHRRASETANSEQTKTSPTSSPCLDFNIPAVDFASHTDLPAPLAGQFSLFDEEEPSSPKHAARRASAKSAVDFGLQQPERKVSSVFPARKLSPVPAKAKARPEAKARWWEALKPGALCSRYSQCCVLRPWTVLVINTFIILAFLILGCWKFKINDTAAGLEWYIVGAEYVGRDDALTAAEVAVGAQSRWEAPRSQTSGLATTYFLYKSRSGNMFTPANIEIMKTVETKLLNHPNFSKFCQLKYNGSEVLGCMPATSVLALLYPSANYTYGMAPLSNFTLAASLGYAAQHLDTLGFFFSRDFSSLNLQSKWARSIVELAVPLDGFTSDLDRTYPQADIVYSGMLRDLDAALVRYTGVKQNYIAQRPPLMAATVAPNKDVEIYWVSTKSILVEIAKETGLDISRTITTAFTVWIHMAVHTKSLLLATLVVAEMLIAMPVAYCFYFFVCQVKFFGGMQLVMVIVLCGIGADHLCVFVDAYKQALLEPAVCGSLLTRMDYTIQRSTAPLFLTTFTTAAAFAACATNTIMPLRAFGVFSVLLVLAFFAINLMLLPPAMVLWARRYEDLPCCVCCIACVPKNLKSDVQQARQRKKMGTLAMVAGASLEEVQAVMTAPTIPVIPEVDEEVGGGMAGTGGTTSMTGEFVAPRTDSALPLVGEALSSTLPTAVAPPVARGSVVMRRGSIMVSVDAGAAARKRPMFNAPRSSIMLARNVNTEIIKEAVEASLLVEEVLPDAPGSANGGGGRRSSITINTDLTQPPSPTPAATAPPMAGMRKAASKRASMFAADLPDPGVIIDGPSAAAPPSLRPQGPASGGYANRTRQRRRSAYTPGGSAEARLSGRRQSVFHMVTETTVNVVLGGELRRQGIADLRPIEKFFHRIWFPFVVRTKWLWALAGIGLLTYGAVEVLQMEYPKVAVPYFPAQHMMQRWLDYMGPSGPFTPVPATPAIVNIVWGISGMDTSAAHLWNSSSRGTVAYDAAFDASSAAAQMFLLDICARAQAAPCSAKACAGGQLVPPAGGSCAINGFQTWLQAAGRQMPLPPEDFLASIAEYAALPTTSAAYPWQLGLVHRAVVALNGSTSSTPRLQYLQFSFQTTFSLPLPPTDVDEVMEVWEDWTQQLNAAAPAGLERAYQVCQTDHAWAYSHTRKALITHTKEALAFMVLLVFVMINIITGNLIVSLLATSTLVGTVTSVMGIVVRGIMHWDFGQTESAAIFICVGLSVDYTLLLTGAYIGSYAPTNSEKVQGMLTTMGISIYAASNATMSAGLNLIFCTLIVFRRFAAVICLSTFCSFCWSIIFFPSILLLLGPEGEMGEWSAMWRWLRRSPLGDWVTYTAIGGTADQMRRLSGAFNESVVRPARRSLTSARASFSAGVRSASVSFSAVATSRRSSATSTGGASSRDGAPTPPRLKSLPNDESPSTARAELISALTGIHSQHLGSAAAAALFPARMGMVAQPVGPSMVLAAKEAPVAGPSFAIAASSSAGAAAPVHNGLRRSTSSNDGGGMRARTGGGDGRGPVGGSVRTAVDAWEGAAAAGTNELVRLPGAARRFL